MGNLTKSEVLSNIQGMMNKVFEYADSVLVDDDTDVYTLDTIANNNDLRLKESIRNICSSDANSNHRLMATLDSYVGAINNGAYDECLYESLLQNLSMYTYLLPVQKEYNRITESVKNNIESITITKILEQMAQSPSYNLLPLIEEDAVRYAKNPTAINRTQLRNAILVHAADPFIRQMLEALELDGDMIVNTLDEQAMAIKDQVKIIREHANVNAIYSPVQYIKENECVFNVRGQFYVKKGNTLAKINDSYISQLSEGFISLCHLVNDDNVSINEDHIILFGHDKIAKIFEDHAEINGNMETKETLRSLPEMQMRYDSDTNFFVMASCLIENFDNIALINFAKHISLNENTGISVDLFRLGDNIFINTINEDIDKSTFYVNVNPLQCRNIINTHMNINVSSLFEDLMPSQDKILLRLNETKNEYENSIKKYEDTISKLKKAKEECISEDNAKKLDAAIETATKKVEELKDEYKDWQEQVEKAKSKKSEEDKEEEKDKEKEADDNTDVETTSEPIDKKDVEDAKPELQLPLTPEETDSYDAESDETSGELSDEEFDDMLDNAEEDNAIETDEETADELTDDTAVENSENDSDEDTEDFSEDPDNIEAFKEINIDDELEEDPSAEDTQDTTEEDNFTFDEEDDNDYATDNVVLGSEVPDEIAKPEPVAVPEGYKIANIAFDKNIKTGEIFKTGNVVIVTPMVDADGRMYVESKDYKFYIDEETKMPVIDVADIPVALYQAIHDAIINDESFEEVVNSATSAYDTKIENTQEVVNPDEKDTEENAIDIDLNTDDDEYISAQKVKAESDKLNKHDENAYFNFEDDEDELTISAKGNDDNSIITADELFREDETPENIGDETDSLFNDNGEIISDDDDSFTFDDDEDSEEPVVIPTYKSGDTEIELPAPSVDDTEIPEEETPESAEVVRQAMADEFEDDEQVEECNCQNDKCFEYKSPIIGVKSVLEKNGKRFFLNEGTIKPSQKKDAHVSEATNANIDSTDIKCEAPNGNYNNNAIDMLLTEAIKASATTSSSNHSIVVSEMQTLGDVRYFDMTDFLTSAEINSYTFYQMGNSVYCRPTYEFTDILERLYEENSNTLYEALTVKTDETTDMDYADASNMNECIEYLENVFMSFGISESIKIRKPKLGADHDFENTKFVDDILYGDEEQRNFEEKIEKDTQKDGIDNPLAPQAPAQESVVYRMPNAHDNSLDESLKTKIQEDKLEYQILDWVIIKETGMKAQVTSINVNGEGEVTNVTILASNGVHYDLDSLDEIEPDPLYIDNIGGRVQNSQKLSVPRFAEMNIDPKTRLVRQAENEEPVEMADMNGRYTPVYIVVNGFKINMTPLMASVEDIMESKKSIRVINEQGEEVEYDVEKDLEFTELPYAVIVDGDGKPVRRIQIDPVSYINAGEEDLVNCVCGGKQTQFPKKVINILS